MYSRQISIGPDFFAKAKSDYTDWLWAIIREFMQNGIDCGSDRIDIHVSLDGGLTCLRVANDGAPMDEEELTNKLLALGASGKDFLGTIGGFGKAKEILYYCHHSYSIRTGHFMVKGSGAGYNLSKIPHFEGTESTVIIHGKHVDELRDHIQTFAAECQWKGELYLDGQRLETNLWKGRRRRDLGWAVVYTNKTFPHRLIVRVDGMPMFSRYTSVDRCVIVEVMRSSGEAFQSNRDGLQWEYRSKLESFVDELNVDKTTALRDVPCTTYLHYEGDKQACSSADSEAVRELVTAAYATLPQQVSPDPDEETETIATDEQTNSNDLIPVSVGRECGRCGYEFIIKNTTGLQVPQYFLPNGFSAYSKKLVDVWIKCLLELHRLFGYDDEFAVGFLFDDEHEAEHETTEEYGRVYYINPAMIVEQTQSRSRSLKKRWKFNNAGYWAILSVALHELLHGRGNGPHDEDFACKQTDLQGVVLANKKVFYHCFRQEG